MKILSINTLDIGQKLTNKELNRTGIVGDFLFKLGHLT